ncbi:MAG: chorismate synthase [Solobacterium sp.]|nr:chorismate synthase [Solobacterium sp.]
MDTFGKMLKLTVFGESHGPAVGGVIDGMPSGVKIDLGSVQKQLDRRRASAGISTARREKDIPEILSGVYNGMSTGTPLAFILRNSDARREDYDSLLDVPRPSHADYSGHIRFRGYEDRSGGGHFSGRLTAVLTFAGALAEDMLKEKGILTGTHIRRIGTAEDEPFDAVSPEKQLKALAEKKFPVLSAYAAKQMKEIIVDAANEMDSVGGITETAVSGLPAGYGEPFFDSLESRISHAVFSIPAVKGIEFGAGFALADMKGSEANDPFVIRDGKIRTSTNHSGGINGGISNGMPIVFRTVLRPTPSIGIVQKSVHMDSLRDTALTIEGRHDPCIVHRACPVIDAVTALVIADVVMEAEGRNFFAGEAE